MALEFGILGLVIAYTRDGCQVSSPRYITRDSIKRGMSTSDVSDILATATGPNGAISCSITENSTAVIPAGEFSWHVIRMSDCATGCYIRSSQFSGGMD